MCYWRAFKKCLPYTSFHIQLLLSHANDLCEGRLSSIAGRVLGSRSYYNACTYLFNTCLFTCSWFPIGMHTARDPAARIMALRGGGRIIIMTTSYYSRAPRVIIIFYYCDRKKKIFIYIYVCKNNKRNDLKSRRTIIIGNNRATGKCRFSVYCFR